MIPDKSIVHLGQSGTLIRVGDRILIFDYMTPESERPDGMGIEQGYINPSQLVDEHVVVFVSHHHADHFTNDIFRWRDSCRSIRYVVSSDVENTPEKTVVMEPGETRHIDNLIVKTYPSTDIGVAFTVLIDDLHIYFCGDNGFWNWDNEASENDYIQNVLGQLDRSQPIDIGIQVCDPRLEQWGAGGIILFAVELQPGLLVPVHAFGQYQFNKKIQAKLKESSFSGRFWPIEQRGDIWIPEQRVDSRDRNLK